MIDRILALVIFLVLGGAGALYLMNQVHPPKGKRK
jgi:hypothetical protein